jgi:hypothetical protein
MLRKFFDTFFQSDFPKYGKSAFREHYKEIRRLVPPEKLLEYKVSEGWGPLCEFLGHDIPEGVPFPCSNDTNGFTTRCRTRNRMQFYNVVLRYSIYILILAMVWLLVLRVQVALIG